MYVVREFQVLFGDVSESLKRANIDVSTSPQQKTRGSRNDSHDELHDPVSQDDSGDQVHDRVSHDDSRDRLRNRVSLNDSHYQVLVFVHCYHRRTVAAMYTDAYMPYYPPNLGDIVFGMSVCLSVCLSVCPSVRDAFCGILCG